MSTVAFDKDLFKEAKRHSVGMVILAAGLLTLASLSLLATSLFASSTSILVGQILFVVLVFSAVTLLVITAIAQDIRKRRVLGDRERSHGV